MNEVQPRETPMSRNPEPATRPVRPTRSESAHPPNHPTRPVGPTVGRGVLRSTVASVAAAAVMAAAAFHLSGCVTLARGKCYIEEPRYQTMRRLFVATNSLQQVEHAMEAEGWSRCERNEFRYRLTKDLDLVPVPEPLDPGLEFLP